LTEIRTKYVERLLDVLSNDGETLGLSDTVVRDVVDEGTVVDVDGRW
jgi:hypothetical protein